MSLNPKSFKSTFRGKTAVITGGGQGIGKALAQELGKCGAKVAIADLSLENALFVAKTIGGLGFQCDVTQEQQIESLVSKVQKYWGTIDLFISNAGVCLGEKDHSASASNEVWKKNWEVNVMAHVYAVRAALPEMIKRQKGHFFFFIQAWGNKSPDLKSNKRK